MRELLETLDAWRAEGADVGRAVVIRTFGSAPRPEGAVLATTADGRVAGSVSGGCVEGAAAEEIEQARQSNARVICYGISDEQAWDVGLACGGTIDVLVQPAIPAAALDAARAAGAANPTGSADRNPAARRRAAPRAPRASGRRGARPLRPSAWTPTGRFTAASAIPSPTRRWSRRRRTRFDGAPRERSSPAVGRCSSKPSRSAAARGSSARPRSRDPWPGSPDRWATSESSSTRVRRSRLRSVSPTSSA